MAMLDIGPKFARERKSVRMDGLSADQLMAMRIHDVRAEFVRDMRNLGYHATADELVSLKIHGATTEFVKTDRRFCATGRHSDKLVSMRIHGVTPEYIDRDAFPAQHGKC